MLSHFRPGCVVAAALATLASSACEQVPLGAPTRSTISVSAGTTSLAPGGTTEIIAFVIEDGGTPVQNGTLVRFTATLGTVNPVEVETRGGTAVTRFTAANVSGVARIRATSGSATGGDGDSPSNVVEIQVGASAAESVTLSASPARVPANGGTVTLTAAVMDANGNRLTGVPVGFSTTAGTLSAASATTDSSGDARVTLNTNRAAKVTVSARGKTATADIEVGSTATVSLSVTPPNPVAGQAVTLTVTPSAIPTGSQAPRVVVTWGDGTTSDMGTVSAARSTTHVYNSSGTYNISAVATADGESSTAVTTISVSAATTATVTLSVTTTNPTEGQPVTLSVTPAIAAGGQAPRVIVSWGDGSQTDLGTVAGTTARTTTHVYNDAGTYTITATATAEGTSTASTTVTVASAPPIGVDVTSSASPTKCQSVTFTAATTPSTEAISRYDWTVDGTDREDERVRTTGRTLTRVFRDAGLKRITVTATTPDGRAGNGDIVINVVNPTPPVVCE